MFLWQSEDCWSQETCLIIWTLIAHVMQMVPKLLPTTSFVENKTKTKINYFSKAEITFYSFNSSGFFFFNISFNFVSGIAASSLSTHCWIRQMLKVIKPRMTDEYLGSVPFRRLFQHCTPACPTCPLCHGSSRENSARTKAAPPQQSQMNWERTRRGRGGIHLPQNTMAKVSLTLHCPLLHCPFYAKITF